MVVWEDIIELLIGGTELKNSFEKKIFFKAMLKIDFDFFVCNVRHIFFIKSVIFVK